MMRINTDNKADPMGSHKPIRIFLADDHPLLRIGLRLSLNQNPGITVVNEADNGFKAVQKILDSCPDVVLMDVDMPGLSGIETTRMLRTTFPEMVILVLSNYNDEKYINDAMAAGANGYISKNIGADDLVSLIKAFYRRQTAVSPYLVNLSISRPRPAPAPDPSTELTVREKQVLLCITEGKTNKDIASELFISLETEKSHTKSIFRKLDVKNRVEAARKAMRHDSRVL
jgi:DNA-binding NarL/FixJ family response regulator